jgi:multicomponent Na+:H+ antiporter subunit D
MGAAMALVGVVYALLQNDMRRLLSYHIQSQVGYMVAGVGIGTALATAGAFAHVFNHILYKALLFMTAGVVIARTDEQSLKYLGGLGRALPVTALAFTVAALSISGFPGFNGFVSKGMITAAAHKEHLDGIFYILLAAGVGTFMSFIKFGYYAFLKESSGTWSVQQSVTGQRVAMLGVAGLCVVLGLFPDALFALLPGSTADAHPFTLGHLGEGFALAALGVVGFAVLKKPLSKIGPGVDVDRVLEPLTFYVVRGVVRAATELFAAVDRGAVATAQGALSAAGDPYGTIRGPLSGVVGGDEPLRDGSLRAGIATSVLLVIVVLAATLVGLL